MDERIGTTLEGRYRIDSELAAGGMGVVYRGQHLGLGRELAIKFLHEHIASDPSLIERFRVEAQAMAKLRHPNCAAVIDSGVDDGAPYVVMDLITGESLGDMLARARLTPQQTLGIMHQILSGLAHAHEQGIIHRDIKPDNVMVDRSEAFGDRVSILDFGLAKLRERSPGLTSGFIVGTPNYMAPEQTLMQPVDERTDIYAAGVVLYEMLTGDKPFRSSESIEVMRMHREDPVPPLAQTDPALHLSSELEAAVIRALAKQPGDRFASAADFATALGNTPEALHRVPSSPQIAIAQIPADAAAPAGKADRAAPNIAIGDAPTAPVSSATMELSDSDIVADSSPDEPIETASTEPNTLPDGTPADAVAPVHPGGTPPTPTADSAPSTTPAAPPAADLAVPASAPPHLPPTDPNGGPADALAPPAPTAAALATPPRRIGRVIALLAAALAALVAIAVIARQPSEPSAQAGDPLPTTADPTQPAVAPSEPRDPAHSDDRNPTAEPQHELFAAARELLTRGEPEAAREQLTELQPKHNDQAELHYLLGQSYFATLWCSDGIKAFREAIRLNPAYRDDPTLIKSAVYGLANDADHRAVRLFLLREIGQPAIPALTEMAENYPRKEVRDRAARALRQLR